MELRSIPGGRSTVVLYLCVFLLSVCLSAGHVCPDGLHSDLSRHKISSSPNPACLICMAAHSTLLFLLLVLLQLLVAPASFQFVPAARLFLPPAFQMYVRPPPGL